MFFIIITGKMPFDPNDDDRFMKGVAAGIKALPSPYKGTKVEQVIVSMMKHDPK